VLARFCAVRVVVCRARFSAEKWFAMLLVGSSSRFSEVTEELILLGVSGSGQRKGRRPRNPAGLEGCTAKVSEPRGDLGVGGRQQHKTA